jgi:3-hydroxyisobutyrate dehydrogenase-like beta-hydroxyacid dehydrogenase
MLTTPLFSIRRRFRKKDLIRAVILVGTGSLGGATAERPAAAAWAVDVTGRDPKSMTPALSSVGDGVDLPAYRAADVRALLPVMTSVRSSVLISSRAVCVDPVGNHIN